MFERVKEKFQDMKAWHRGETRVAPPGARGRVYAKKSDTVSTPDNFRAVSTGKAELQMVIVRANGDRTTVTVPAGIVGNP